MAECGQWSQHYSKVLFCDQSKNCGIIKEEMNQSNVCAYVLWDN